MITFPGKIPVTITPYFWVLALLISWLNTFTVTGTIILTIIILVSVLIHEYGHAMTAMAFGQRAHIELVAFGGVTQRYGGGRLKLWKEFVIVLNGPLAGLCLALAAWMIHQRLAATHPDSVVTYIAMVTFYANVFWTVVNLIPVQPLDGGRLLSIFLESFLGLRGKKIALFISLLFAIGAGLFFFSIRGYLAGALFFMFAFESYRTWWSSLALTEQDEDFILQHQLKEAERDVASGAKTAALDKFQRIRELAKAGVIYQAATENVALLQAEKGDIKESYDLLISLGNKISPQGLKMLHQLTYRRGNWKEAAALGSQAYHYYPDYDTAVINAICHSLLGEVKPAIGWLQCAIKEGIPNINDVLALKEFDAIRQDPSFRQLLQK